MKTELRKIGKIIINFVVVMMLFDKVGESNMWAVLLVAYIFGAMSYILGMEE